MSHQYDPRLDEAKAMDFESIAIKFGVTDLRKMGQELVGPCPKCGGTDRFAINTRKGAFQCRKCEFKGGDQIAFVQGLEEISFKEALAVLCGDAPIDVDPAELERRKRRAAEAKEKQRKANEGYRLKAIKDARIIWGRARPGHIGVVGTYLAARGLGPSLVPVIPSSLRFIVRHRYVKKIRGEWRTLYEGPCMIAEIMGPGGQLTAVHQTWIDQEPPHGKAKIIFEGQEFPSKLVRGSAKGGAIRLSTPPEARTLVMGEGIETTLSAMAAQPVPDAAYWAGIDLGKMAGVMLKEPGKRYSGQPDMTDEAAFVPPPWVERLIFIQDGDSEPKMTRAKLACGLRRAMAMRPGLRAQIVHAGEGVDLNDVLTGGK